MKKNTSQFWTIRAPTKPPWVHENGGTIWWVVVLLTAMWVGGVTRIWELVCEVETGAFLTLSGYLSSAGSVASTRQRIFRVFALTTMLLKWNIIGSRDMNSSCCKECITSVFFHSYLKYRRKNSACLFFTYTSGLGDAWKFSKFAGFCFQVSFTSKWWRNWCQMRMKYLHFLNGSFQPKLGILSETESFFELGGGKFPVDCLLKGNLSDKLLSKRIFDKIGRLTIPGASYTP